MKLRGAYIRNAPEKDWTGAARNRAGDNIVNGKRGMRRVAAKERARDFHAIAHESARGRLFHGMNNLRRSFPPHGKTSYPVLCSEHAVHLKIRPETPLAWILLSAGRHRSVQRVSLKIRSDGFSAYEPKGQCRKILAWLPEGNHRKSYQLDVVQTRKAAENQFLEVP